MFVFGSVGQYCSLQRAVDLRMLCMCFFSEVLFPLDLEDRSMIAQGTKEESFAFSK